MKNIWNGFIQDFNKDEIICILRKDFNLDKELTIKRELLDEKQNDLVSLGTIIQFDFIKNKIQFLLEDLTWY